MAVYTKVSIQDLDGFLKHYDIGRSRSLKGIAEGVENSNYLLETTQDRYILTLYEKRVDPKTLPFFMNLMAFLAAQDLPVAMPVADSAGNMLHQLSGRPAALITFLTGVSVDTPSVAQCAALGTILGTIHRATDAFKEQRPNCLSLSGWRQLAQDCHEKADTFKAGTNAFITRQLAQLEKYWPAHDHLPRGIIHADLFPDNVLFSGNQITGVIDFYFACTDFYAYDLAICLNAWCFDAQHQVVQARVQALFDAYTKIRPLCLAEKKALPLLCHGAAFRFFLTRLYDWMYHDPRALVQQKHPEEYSCKTTYHATHNIMDFLVV